MGPRALRHRSIADHPALPIKIAHPVRVYSPAGAVQLRFSTMATELIFTAADPARVAIPIEPASICHRNGQSRSRMVERREWSGCGRNRKRDCNADPQYKREKFFHFVFHHACSQIIQPRDCVVQNAIRACANRSSLLQYSTLRDRSGEPYSALARPNHKANRCKLSARLGNRC